MLAEPPAPAVGENNQRQLRARDGTILHARQPNFDGRLNIAERDMFRLAGAWIPDGAREIRIGIEQLDAGGSRRSAQTTEYDGVSPILPEHQSSPQSGKCN
jgi:hypothetical protein